MNKIITSKCNEVLRAHIAEQIKTKRKKLNLSGEALAVMIGYKPGTIRMWEARQSFSRIPISTLYLLSVIFDCPIGDFLLSVDEFIDRTGLKIKSVSITTNVITLANETSEASQ